MLRVFVPLVTNNSFSIVCLAHLLTNVSITHQHQISQGRSSNHARATPYLNGLGSRKGQAKEGGSDQHDGPKTEEQQKGRAWQREEKSRDM